MAQGESEPGTVYLLSLLVKEQEASNKTERRQIQNTLLKAWDEDGLG